MDLCACLAAQESVGPLYQDYQLTLEPGQRTELLGPFFYHEHKDALHIWAFPPLMSDTVDAAADSEEFDFLYPLVTYDRFGQESRFQILQFFSFSGGQALAGTNVSKFTLFPLYFQERSAMPERNYTAVFPIYGKLKNRLFRDETEWVLWPLYVKTKRRPMVAPVKEDEFLASPYRFFRARKGDITTYNFLTPIFHLRYGEQLRGWQFWPLAGHEHKAVTYRTNAWDEVETIGGHDKFFTLWPLFFHDQTDVGTENPARQWIVLPFYNSYRSPLRDSTGYLWPLGPIVTDDRARKYKEWDLFWPLIVFARGEGKTANRVLPFFSLAHNDTQTSQTYLWPVYRYYRIQSAPLDRRRTRLLFFLYSDTTDLNTETGKSYHHVECWPLFSSRTEFEGQHRFQILALLEPFAPYSKSIERNYSPVWALWRSQKNPHTGAASQSLLWNLYRRDRTPDTQKCSLLFGLFQYKSGPDGRQLRLFYVPLSKSNKTL